jgi:group I intron endonuclease
MIYVYRISNKASGKCYIGQTVNIDQRWASHKYSSDCTKLSSAIQKHGQDAFMVEVLEVVQDRQEANVAEVFYIQHYGSLDREKGYNLRSGGVGNDRHSPESRAKMAAARFEHLHPHSKLTKEQRADIRQRYSNRKAVKTNQYLLAAEFGVNQSTIAKVVRGYK